MTAEEEARTLATVAHGLAPNGEMGFTLHPDLEGQGPRVIEGALNILRSESVTATRFTVESSTSIRIET